MISQLRAAQEPTELWRRRCHGSSCGSEGSRKERRRPSRASGETGPAVHEASGKQAESGGFQRGLSRHQVKDSRFFHLQRVEPERQEVEVERGCLKQITEGSYGPG